MEFKPFQIVSGKYDINCADFTILDVTGKTSYLGYCPLGKEESSVVATAMFKDEGFEVCASSVHGIL